MTIEQTLELHLRRDFRKKYRLIELKTSETGKTTILGNSQIQDLTENINSIKRELSEAEKFYKSSDINALALIEKINHYIVRRYLREKEQTALLSALDKLNSLYGKKDTDKILLEYHLNFSESFRLSLDEKIEKNTMRELLLEEIILLRVCNSNKAAEPYRELFDDRELRDKTPYTPAFYTLLEHFDSTAPFGEFGSNLIRLLLEPALKHPESLQAQIEYMKDMWTFLTDDFLLLLLRSLDFSREENRMFFSGPGPTAPLVYGNYHNHEDEDNPNYSPDSNWMPEVILLAKNTLVWLTQLTRDYGKPIRRLDQIPDEELDIMASRGINCLWLIGIWNRSNASREIKRRCGNPDAVSSAYSLFSYDISWEIGGWDALGNLKERCRTRGIRLASDMVPNHTGIDSEWTRSHPDWFIQTARPPFPSYRYESENLSEDPGIGIYLEDHYYNKTDAAVTYKRVNFHNGETRYIYHGNDGTSMPWNDTAQLDFLKKEVREAVIDQILHVARNFPVIRFDAAMTLAKKHIQRLWYPAPGHGGDIASRSNFAMSDEDFHNAVGGEFWKDVVNRVASEASDTLLLAEAFWMMEGYFVRNLGMHRVYNSAFMNMLKNEENGKYRETIKNTLNYDRKILKRFVNFMNNPDEETAAVQFGTGDKYFGVLTLMLTMPGLPMIGHGQIEGYKEKYGMEFHKPLRDEHPDRELVERHEREIFPLMRRRYLFVSSNRFRLYDLYNHDGSVNDNVFAYSNRCDREFVLVLYNNAYERAEGIINRSAPYIENDSDSTRIETNSLGESLGLTCDGECYCLLREAKNGVWYIRNSREIYERGLFIQLNGYESHVFVDIHELRNSEANHIAAIGAKLQGRGTPDLDREYREMVFQPVYSAYDRLISKEIFDRMEYLDIDELIEPLTAVIETVKSFSGGTGETGTILKDIAQSIKGPRTALDAIAGEKDSLEFLKSGLNNENRIIIYLYSLFRYAGYIVSPGNGEKINRDLLDSWMIAKYLRDRLRDMSVHEETIDYLLAVLKFFFEKSGKISKLRTNTLSRSDLLEMQNMDGFRQLLGLNRYNEILWFSRERLEKYIWWAFYVELQSASGKKAAELYKSVQLWLKASEKSEYNFDEFIKLI